jgi:hypothetical protein
MNNVTRDEFIKKLSEVSLDCEDCIEEDFFLFDKGTCIFEIWRYIEEHYDCVLGAVFEGKE